jgi:hypothetical protein
MRWQAVTSEVASKDLLQESSSRYYPIQVHPLYPSGIIILKQAKSPFKWRHFEPTIILLCVRWYCRYQLSYRDLEEMMSERGLSVDHTTVWRWVQRYAPEINKRIRPHLKMSGTSNRVDGPIKKLEGAVSISTVRLIRRGILLNSCSPLDAMFQQQNGSSRR